MVSFLGIFFAIIGPLYGLGIDAILIRFVPELIAKKNLPRTRRLLKIAARIKLAGEAKIWGAYVVSSA